MSNWLLRDKDGKPIITSIEHENMQSKIVFPKISPITFLVIVLTLIYFFSLLPPIERL